ncbi:hypothetical protein GCM10009682_11070 [Luedemannella flava]|uniref:RES domain-containing protein n=1 Tax=Luedemannella flava TaxID=349316 RepID=A0ABP4XWL5_9ACTN
MRHDDIADLITRYVLVPGETVRRRHDDRPDAVEIDTGHRRYLGSPAPWAIAHAAGVAGAARVYSPSPDDMPNFDLTYGFVVLAEGGVRYLNRVDDMADLGRLVAAGLDPLAYAEVLAELYTSPDISGPLVIPISFPGAGRSGFLLRDPEPFLANHPGVDPAAVTAPVVQRAGDAVDLRFTAYEYQTAELTTLVNVWTWHVRATAAAPATWERVTVVRGLPVKSHIW